MTQAAGDHKRCCGAIEPGPNKLKMARE